MNADLRAEKISSVPQAHIGEYHYIYLHKLEKNPPRETPLQTSSIRNHENTNVIN